MNTKLKEKIDLLMECGGVLVERLSLEEECHLLAKWFDHFEIPHDLENLIEENTEYDEYEDMDDIDWSGVRSWYYDQLEILTEEYGLGLSINSDYVRFFERD